MIRVNYGGRLGNRLFQYCLGRYLAEEMGYELSADPLPFPATLEQVKGHQFHQPQEHVGWFDAHISSILSNPSNRMIVLNGNFQYYSYYKPFMDRIRKWCSFPDTIIPYPGINKNDLLIYVRLGDYFDAGISLTFPFYEVAIKMAAPSKIFIVTEDQTHPFLKNFIPFDPIIISQDPMSDLAIARSFKKIVLSASTFAWWAAILAEPDEVYFPIGDEGHWSPSNMQSPHYNLDLRVDDKRFIYFYNCAVKKSTLENTNLVPLSDACPTLYETERFQMSALRFHKQSRAFWFNSKRAESSVLDHATLLNLLIAKNGYKSYLEIGISDQSNFNSIAIKYSAKVGVDPYSEGATHRVTSDLFFQINDKTYDLIFIDGLHHWEQVYRDICNSLKVLNSGGTIVCHDVNPTTFEEQVVPQLQNTWTGDCWKAWVRLRMEREDLDMKVVGSDYGLGIIKPGKQKLLPYVDNLDWNGLVANRVEWLNLISSETFLESIST